MQRMNKHNAFITGILLAVLAGSLGCRSDAEKYEVINAFLSEFESQLQEHSYTKGDSLALYYEVKGISYHKNILRFPMNGANFIGSIKYRYSIPEELKNGQSDEEFMENFLSQEDMMAWNRGMWHSSKEKKFWDPARIKKYKVLKEYPYYMAPEFMPLEIPKGGYPIDMIVDVSEPLFNTSRDKVLLDVVILSGPQVVSFVLYLMFKTKDGEWKILFSNSYAGS